MRAQAVNEDELGALLRREGLHEEDLERVRQEVMQAATEYTDSARPLLS